MNQSMELKQSPYEILESFGCNSQFEDVPTVLQACHSILPDLLLQGKTVWDSFAGYSDMAALNDGQGVIMILENGNKTFADSVRVHVRCPLSPITVLTRWSQLL